MKDLFGLSGKVVMVVGGGQGMGETTSLRLAEQGCDIAVIDLDIDRANAMADRVRALGRRACAIAVDVLDVTQAAPTVAKVEAELGGLDIMATIVGKATVTDFFSITPEIWDFDHQINLRYFFFWAQAAAASMIRSGKGGSITAVASICGVASAPQHSAYGAAKAGLISLIKSLAVELAHHKIRINAIAPGVITTPRVAESPIYPEWEKRIANSNIPFKRLGDTDDIADAMVYLSSNMAKYVSGTTLIVDGGFTAQWTLGWSPDDKNPTAKQQ